MFVLGFFDRRYSPSPVSSPVEGEECRGFVGNIIALECILRMHSKNVFVISHKVYTCANIVYLWATRRVACEDWDKFPSLGESDFVVARFIERFRKMAP